jgi:hypothetical protein
MRKRLFAEALIALSVHPTHSAYRCESVIVDNGNHEQATTFHEASTGEFRAL